MGIFARIFNLFAGDCSHWAKPVGLLPAISYLIALSHDSGNPAKLLQLDEFDLTACFAGPCLATKIRKTNIWP